MLHHNVVVNHDQTKDKQLDAARRVCFKWGCVMTVASICLVPCSMILFYWWVTTTFGLIVGLMMVTHCGTGDTVRNMSCCGTGCCQASGVINAIRTMSIFTLIFSLLFMFLTIILLLNPASHNGGNDDRFWVPAAIGLILQVIILVCSIAAIPVMNSLASALQEVTQGSVTAAAAAEAAPVVIGTAVHYQVPAQQNTTSHQSQEMQQLPPMLHNGGGGPGVYSPSESRPVKQV